MYDELVKRLREAPSDWPDAELHYEAANAIEELSKPKWIPVTERLPENGEYVLCFCRANIVCVLRRDKDGDWYENPTHVYMSGFVTHWMPQPEPPKEE